MEPLFLLAQVEKENFVVQELKNHLHQVLKFSENSLLRTKQEAEKQQKADFRASQARVAKIQQEILLLRSQFHNLVMENREAEQALRKVPWGSREAGCGPGRREGWHGCYYSPDQGAAGQELGVGGGHRSWKPGIEAASPGRREGAARRPRDAALGPRARS